MSVPPDAMVTAATRVVAEMVTVSPEATVISPVAADEPVAAEVSPEVVAARAIPGARRTAPTAAPLAVIAERRVNTVMKGGTS